MKSLILQDDNLAQGTKWDDDGYSVQKLFHDDSDYQHLLRTFHRIVNESLTELGYQVNQDFSLSQYHELIKNDEEHFRFIKFMGNFFSANELGDDLLKKLENRISEICKVKVHAKHPDYDEKVFNIRIVRPKSKDNNPLHRDVWLDRLRNGINIYVPIAGSDEKSSLPLIAGSHYWTDDVVERTKEGAIVDGRAYTVPSVTRVNKQYRLVRPNPKNNEVLVFSPYLIHGGASNLNEDTTRVSLEMRFWREKVK